MFKTSFIPFCVTLATAILATGTDLRHLRIPNVFTLPLLATGLLYHGLVGGLAPLLGSLLGVVFGGGILFLLHLRGGMGAGDVKLMAGVGAWLGVPWTVYVFIGSGLAAGAYALILLTAFGWTRRQEDDRQGIEHEVGRPDRRRRLVPFAPMILIGIVAALLWSLSRRDL